MFTYDMIPVPLPALAIDRIYRTPNVDRSEVIRSTGVDQPTIVRLTLSDETTIDIPFLDGKLRDLIGALMGTGSKPTASM